MKKKWITKRQQQTEKVNKRQPTNERIQEEISKKSEGEWGKKRINFLFKGTYFEYDLIFLFHMCECVCLFFECRTYVSKNIQYPQSMTRMSRWMPIIGSMSCLCICIPEKAHTHTYPYIYTHTYTYIHGNNNADAKKFLNIAVTRLSRVKQILTSHEAIR